MKVVFATGVREETTEAKTHYESEVEGLGKAFIAVIHASIQQIKRYPRHSRLFHGHYRRFLVERFPYGIIYRVEEDTIYIVAIAHFKRHPFYWKKREAK